ncbi:hypothetical protein Tsp_11685, partial [Trichinella spiralis]|uniref:hypothetical protein n=1 Tax=Trichinella spiralis TaxID=6334 RepID=UPI0001EFE509
TSNLKNFIFAISLIADNIDFSTKTCFSENAIYGHRFFRNDKKSAMNIARRFPVEYSSGYPVKMGSTRTCYERQYFIFGAHLFHICWVVGLNL